MLLTSVTDLRNGLRRRHVPTRLLQTRLMPSLRLGSVWNGHFWGLLQIGLYLSHSATKCDKKPARLSVRWLMFLLEVFVQKLERRPISLFDETPITSG